jgi:hypothetical protein
MTVTFTNKSGAKTKVEDVYSIFREITHDGSDSILIGFRNSKMGYLTEQLRSIEILFVTQNPDDEWT